MTDPAALALLQRIALATEGQYAELRGIRADLRRRTRVRSAKALAAALADYYAPSDDITTAGLLRLADADPYCAIADALTGLVDLGAPERSRSTTLGGILAGMDCLELVEATRRGAAVYRLRT